MCTTCSECVTDVYVGVKTHLCNVHTLPCTSAQNTCSKVHVTLTAGRAHTRPCIYACTCMHMHMVAYARPKTPPDTPTRRHQDPPFEHTCAHAYACIRVRIYAYTGARAYACTRTHARLRICMHTRPHTRACGCTHARTQARLERQRHNDRVRS